MSVTLTAEQDSELAELARTTERTPDEIVQEVLGYYLAANSEHFAAIERARAQIARGETVPHEEVFARLKQRMGW